MPDVTPLLLSLELDSAADPISGQIVGADGTTRPFRGWLELAAALDAFRKRWHDAPATTTTEPF